MIHKETQELIDAIKPYCNLDTLTISTENKDWKGKSYRSDLVWILKKYSVGFEVLDKEIRVQFFDDHIHFEQWDEDDKASHLIEVKELLVKLFIYPIIKREVFKGKRRIRYEHFFVNNKGERERIEGPWIVGLFSLLSRKESVKEKIYKYSLPNHDFELIDPSLNGVFGTVPYLYINFYNKELVTQSGYRGLYRYSLGYWEITGKSKKFVSDFFDLGIEGSNIPYNEENFEAAKTVYRIFIEQGVNPDLVVISNTDFDDPRFELLGYDICSTSLYYSPIGSGGITGEQPYLLYHMAPELRTDVLADLNGNGLLATKAVALRFAEFCTQNSELIESETTWFPVSVFGYRD